MHTEAQTSPPPHLRHKLRPLDIRIFRPSASDLTTFGNWEKQLTVNLTGLLKSSEIFSVDHNLIEFPIHFVLLLHYSLTSSIVYYKRVTTLFLELENTFAF
jgi:hypothetical protein